MSFRYLDIGKKMLDDAIGQMPNDIRDQNEYLVSKAYDIQSRVYLMRLENGEQLAGYKVGCTSPLIQQKLGINHPIFGRLYRREMHTSGSLIPLNIYSGMGIEGELAVRLREGISVKSSTDKGILSRIESIFPVIELHHYGYLQPPFTAPGMIACNAIHAGFIYSWDNERNADKYPQELSIEVDGQIKAHVSGLTLMKTVENSILWLEQQLNTQGFSTEPGEIILCGSLCDLFSVPKGGEFKVRTDTNQSVECSIKNP